MNVHRSARLQVHNAPAIECASCSCCSMGACSRCAAATRAAATLKFGCLRRRAVPRRRHDGGSRVRRRLLGHCRIPRSRRARAAGKMYVISFAYVIVNMYLSKVNIRRQQSRFKSVTFNMMPHLHLIYFSVSQNCLFYFVSQTTFTFHLTHRMCISCHAPSAYHLSAS